MIDIRDADAAGESVRRFPGHDPDVTAVAYNPDGERLLTTGDDGAARLWDPTPASRSTPSEGQVGHGRWAVDQRRRAAVRGVMAGGGHDAPGGGRGHRPVSSARSRR